MVLKRNLDTIACENFHNRRQGNVLEKEINWRVLVCAFIGENQGTHEDRKGVRMHLKSQLERWSLNTFHIRQSKVWAGMQKIHDTVSLKQECERITKGFAWGSLSGVRLRWVRCRIMTLATLPMAEPATATMCSLTLLGLGVSVLAVFLHVTCSVTWGCAGVTLPLLQTNNQAGAWSQRQVRIPCSACLLAAFLQGQ